MSIKKIATIFLTAALLISILPVIGSAENTETFKVGVEAMTAASTVSASPVIYNQGDVVTVKIRASQNTGITSLKLIVDYNEKFLEPVEGKYKATGLLSAADVLTKAETANGDGYFIFYSDSYPYIKSEVGILAEITFVAKEACVDNTSIVVTPFSNGSCVKNTVSGVVVVPFQTETQTFSIHKINASDSKVTAPTCTADGYTTHSCTACKETVIGNIVPMKGHTPDTAVEENRIAPTCTVDGSYDSVVYCKTASCRAELSRETVCLPKTGHTPDKAVEENRIAPTCTTDGSYDSVVYCKTAGCRAELSRTSTALPMVGHDPADEVTENLVEPKITAVGSCDKVVYCKVCATELSRQTVELPCLVPADGWHEENSKWYFFEDGQMVKNAWRKDSIGWCYLDADGSMVTSKWVQDSIGWCYVGNDGYMVTNKWVQDSIGWCYIGNDGYMVTDKWVQDSTGWCYVGNDGYMVTGKWVQDSTGWCYVGNDGYMVTNKWVQDSTGWCYVGDDGYMVTNKWVQDSTGWCYVDTNGYMLCNTSRIINGKNYHFDANGTCTNP